jgi:C-terminal processing protease CtpA/Prc
LDEFLTGLETNGVLVDRLAARAGGVDGILRSIDPEVIIRSETPPPPPDQIAGGKVQAVELWPENLAYIKVSGLEPGTGKELLGHFQSLSTRSGLLLDLRGARGQDLESACILAGLTRHPQEPLFLITDNRGVPLATNRVAGTFIRMPFLLILMDEGTSGAAEALASVLKGCPGVMLLGTVTRGDPYLRNWLTLPDGRMARLATRKWKPIHGDSCEKVGVIPDVTVTARSGRGNEGLSRTNKTDRALSLKSDADRDLMMRVAGDAVLQRATDILLGLQAVGGYGRE